MDKDELAEMVAVTAQALSEPIDFDSLLEQGLLEKRGRSYYVPDIGALPENVAKRINSTTTTKNGIRVTFSKERKSTIKLAAQLKHHIE
tara:strand:+ start:43553 stop:43819 length:267 start_codon:yes stop_codon:yes gene_type:complete